MGKNGGARPGAGRKAFADRFPSQTEQCTQLLAAHAVAIMQGQIDLAVGAMVMETDKEGGERVYRRPPDQRAGAALIDRFMGKVKDEVDVTTGGESIANDGERFARLVALMRSANVAGD
jgi:hypothetical protein